MLKIKREIIFGVLGITTLLIFIWGVNYLKGTDLLQRQQRFYVIYPRVDGLIESHPVKVNGVSIGQVKRISFHPDRSGRVLVECVITDKVDIPVNTIARLTSSSLIGGYEIVLHLGNGNNFILNSDTLEGTIQPGLQDEITARLAPLSDKADNLFSRLDTLLGSLNSILGHDTKSGIDKGILEANKSLQRIEAITSNLDRQEETINKIIGNLSTLTDSLATVEIGRIVEMAGESIASFNQTLSSMNEGDGTITLLLQDEALYRNLEQSSKQLELLLEDIRNNPKKYFSFSVFGK